MINASESRNTELNKNYDINSQGKGWYYDVASKNRHTTGYYAINNIYDMAGNVWEWTTENCTYEDSNYLVYRGGSYNSLGSNYTVAYRYYNDDSMGYSLGFRVLLYK